MNREADNQNGENSQTHEIGILYERVPQAGVVVQGYDIDELLTHPNVQESEVDEYQRELGVNRAITFKPGIKDQFRYEYSEYMNFDSQNRPIASNQHKGGIYFYRYFEYDQLGRLIKVTNNFGYVLTDTQAFSYPSEVPDENGQFHFEVSESNESHMRPLE